MKRRRKKIIAKQLSQTSSNATPANRVRPTTAAEEAEGERLRLIIRKGRAARAALRSLTEDVWANGPLSMADEFIEGRMASAYGLLQTGPQLRGKKISKRPGEETLREAIALYERGFSMSYLGRKYGVYPQTIKAWLLQEGVPVRKSSKKNLPPDDLSDTPGVGAKPPREPKVNPKRAEAIALVDTGMSITKAAEAVGVVRVTVYRWIREAGFTSSRQWKKPESAPGEQTTKK